MSRKISDHCAAVLSVVLVAGGALLVGCQGRPEAALRARIDAIWNRGRVDLINMYYSDSIAQQLTEQVESTRRFYPNLRMAISSVAIDADLYYFCWTVTATHAKYRKKVELRGVTHGRMQDGKVVEEQIVYDRLDEADQLGFIVRSPTEY